jgi:hypothetical protein
MRLHFHLEALQEHAGVDENTLSAGLRREHRTKAGVCHPGDL